MKLFIAILKWLLKLSPVLLLIFFILLAVFHKHTYSNLLFWLSVSFSCILGVIAGTSIITWLKSQKEHLKKIKDENKKEKKEATQKEIQNPEIPPLITKEQ